MLVRLRRSRRGSQSHHSAESLTHPTVSQSGHTVAPLTRSKNYETNPKAPNRLLRPALPKLRNEPKAASSFLAITLDSMFLSPILSTA